MRIALVAILLATTVAAAAAHADVDDHASAAADPAVAEPSAAAAFDRVVDDTYVAVQDEAVCANGCVQTVVATSALTDGTTVELRRATSDYGDVDAVVFGKGNTWWGGVAIPDLVSDDCAMGKCITNTLAHTVVREAGDVFWVELKMTDRIEHHVTNTVERHRHELVIGCKLGAAPSCMTVAAGSLFADGRARIVDGEVVVDDAHGRTTLAVTW